MVKIDIKEKGTRAFYEEVTCVTVQYAKLLKDPEGKLKNSFKMIKAYIAICVAFLAIVVAMGVAWGMDALTVVAIVVLLAVIVVSGMQLRRLSETVKSLMDDPRGSVITLDEKGVELNKEGAQLIRLAWDNVAFVRVFDESVCLFAKSVRGLVIGVNRVYEQQIFDFVREDDINVKVVGNAGTPGNAASI